MLIIISLWQRIDVCLHIVNTTLCDQICQWRMEGMCGSPGTPLFATNTINWNIKYCCKWRSKPIIESNKLIIWPFSLLTSNSYLTYFVFLQQLLLFYFILGQIIQRLDTWNNNGVFVYLYNNVYISTTVCFGEYLWMFSFLKFLVYRIGNELLTTVSCKWHLNIINYQLQREYREGLIYYRRLKG